MKKLLFAISVFFVFSISDTVKAQVVLNELMVRPAGTVNTPPNGLIYTNSKEYIELYNNGCTSIDVSGYFIADQQSFGGTLSGGTFRIPNVAAAVIPPKSHIVLGPASAAPAAGDVDIVMTLANSCVYAGNFVLANVDGWCALYNAAGVPVDAVYWTSAPGNLTTQPADFGGTLCLPAGSPAVTLPNAQQINTGFPGVLKYGGSNFTTGGTPLSRQPDGANNWVQTLVSSISNAAATGNCNGGVCYAPVPAVTGFSYATPFCASGNATPIPVAGFITGGTYSAPFGVSINAATGVINLATSLPNTYTITYTVTATVCSGAGSSTTSITINAAPVAPTATVSAQPTCATPTGTITITAPTGANLEYSINGSTYQAGTSFSGLAPNTYSVTVKNTATGCISPATTLTVNAVPTAPLAPTASVTVQPTCTVPTGTIVVTAPTGAGLEYSVNGVNYQAGTAFTGLAPNNYNVTVKNTVTGCISSATVLTVNALPASPVAPTASVTVQPTCTTPTGTIVISAPTGVNLEYSVNGINYQAGLSFTGLAPNNYNVTVKNTVTGCVSPVTPLTVNPVSGAPAVPTASVTVQPTCTTPTGTIVVTAPTGVNLEYSVNGSTYQTGLTFTGLAPNNYNVTVKNTATGCVSAATVLTVNAVPAPPGAPAVSVTQPTCTVATGTITITGVAGETYSFDGGTYSATLVYSGLAASSSHTIFAKNAAGCISVVTNASINAQPATPGAPAVTVTQPTCTVATGTITITGVPGETYSFDGGTYAATLVYGGLAASSSHTIFAKNAAGCISVVTNASINAQPATPGAPAVTVTQPTCAVATGTITITGVPGVTYSFDGGTYSATLVYGGLAASSSHTIFAKNAAGCISVVTNASINAQPATPGAPAVTITQPTCTVATGTITITGVLGETYSFDGGTYAATLVYGGLAASTSHTIFAKNAAGCISVVTNASINAQPAIPGAPVVTVTQPTCAVATGTITITGVPGETYSFDGGVYAATLIYGGLAAGSSHTVLAKNAAGCISAVTNASVNSQPALPGAPSVTVTQPSCTVATGSISITGVPGETYSFDGGIYAATLVYGSLIAGSSHTIFAKNAGGCISVVTNVAINAQPATPGTPAVTVTHPTCTVATGTITITGVAGETYSVDGGTYSATLIYSGLAAGSSHTILAKNAAGCISTVTNASVNAQPATPGAPAVTVTQPTCTVATGTIAITGVPGETYSFDGSAYTATLIYGGLAGGTSHTILAKNAAGCISVVTNASINAQPVTPGAPAVTVTQPSCTVATGTITITGVTGETYSFDGGTYTSTLIYSGLSAGSSHTIIAKNAAGCISAVTNASINAQPATPGVPAVTVTQPTCTVATGTITISGIPGETYSFDGGAYAATLVYAGLAASSSHTILAKNAAGCISAVTNSSINAQPATPAAPAVTVTQPTCTVASATITITGITGLTYSFDGGAYAATLVYGGLAAGSSHNISATNTAGCISAVTNTTINVQPATPVAPVVTVTQPSCSVATGSISITAVSGEIYSLDGGAYAATLVYAGLAASSSHTILAKNAAGCISAATTVTINLNPTRPVVNFDLPTGLCLPNASAFFNNTTTISDGTIGLVTYVWNFGDASGNVASPPNSPTHIYTAGGPFTVTLTATSNAGCVDSVKKTLSIINTPTAKDSVINKNHLCSNQPVMLVNLSSVTGTGTVTKVEVYWDFPNMGVVTTDNTPLPNNSYTHVYPEFGAPDTVYKTVVVRAYNANGCFSDSVQVIKLLASPKIQLNALPSVCEDVPSLNLAGAIDMYGLGGNGVVLSGPGITVSPNFSPVLTGDGTFTIIYRDTAANGCLTSATQNIVVKPNPVLVYPSAFTTEPGYNVSLNPSAVSGIGLTYTWTELPNSNFPPANYLDNPISPVPTVLNPTHDVKYLVTVTSNPDGCVDSAQVTVNVLYDFVVPNTFTPNNDGVNDYWEIDNLAKYPAHRVQVFNRYGQLLFETSKYVHWDGTYKGKPLPFGTYYYIIELGGVRNAKTGYVTIIK